MKLSISSYLFNSQRNEMSASQDPPEPLPQRPHRQPGLGGELCSSGEGGRERERALLYFITWLPDNR